MRTANAQIDGIDVTEAPAAKHYHQAYRHGLLEHCLGVAQAVSAISAAKVQLAVGGKYVTQQAIQLHGGIGIHL